MTLFVSQSNYIPWKGYFDMINMADVFVIWDDVQYVKKSWRNRNQIKTKDGLKWLTIPVQVSGRFHQDINETVIADQRWARKHWRALEVNYAKAPYFKDYADKVQAWYEQLENTHLLSEVNRFFLEKISTVLGITTSFRISSEFDLAEGRNERVIDLCRQLQGDVLLNGPSAKEHMDEEQFIEAGIEVKYMDYSGYPEYPQLYGTFRHDVTILDLLFNAGPESTAYMKSFNKTAK